jgi:4-alpha-glucanotransferase
MRIIPKPRTNRDLNRRLISTSPAPNQDVMRLDNSARMNVPGRAAGNWAWRAGDAGLWARLEPEARELRAMAYAYGRLPKGARVGHT